MLERGPATNPLFGAFFEAVQQAGYALTDDVNGYRQEGFARFDRNVHRGRRLSAVARLPPSGDEPPNLDVVTRANVQRVLFDGTRATGVEYRTWRGSQRTVRAGEVILCGGAFNSPQLLQVSGVGDADHLRGVGVDLVHHLPGVGENLQDHLEVYVQHACEPAGLAQPVAQVALPAVGRAAVAVPQGTGRVEPLRGRRVRPQQRRGALPEPDVPLPADRRALRRFGSPAGGHGYQVHIGPMYSDVRGSVRITSPDAQVKPALRFNYLSTPNDRREWVEAIRIARRHPRPAGVRRFDAGEISPGPAVESDEQILDWVARDAETALHPSCTCAMGTGETSVVDPRTMRVHGVEGLRVVDASVMPYVTNGNIYAPVMMLAEKASDLILGNTPLAPEPVPFYRHGAIGARYDVVPRCGSVPDRGWPRRAGHAT